MAGGGHEAVQEDEGPEAEPLAVVGVEGEVGVVVEVGVAPDVCRALDCDELGFSRKVGVFYVGEVDTRCDVAGVGGEGGVAI